MRRRWGRYNKYHNVRYCACGHKLEHHARVREGQSGKALMQTVPAQCQTLNCPCRKYQEVHGSTGEKDWYSGLVQQQTQGLIANLRRQVRFKLLPKQGKEWPAIYYIADAVFNDCVDNNRLRIQDYKGGYGGKARAAFNLKRRLMHQLGLKSKWCMVNRNEKRNERRS